jgi:hypothetical protein
MKLATTTFALAVLTVMFAGSAIDKAQADPYKWCALYNAGRGGGSQNCYFITWQQCQTSVSGVGGFCMVNQFYDGKPVVTPEDRGARPKKKIG